MDARDGGEGARIPRDTVFIAVFGGLWGFVELTMGVPLKTLRIPLSGAVLAASATLVCLTGRYFVPRFGAVLMMGCVAALVKLFSTGFVILGPFLAILIEATLAEVVTTVLGVRRVSYVLSGMALLLYTILHPFLMQGVLFGAEIYRVYLEMIQRAGQFLHVDSRYLWFVAIGYAGLHALAGGLVGWVAWALAVRVNRELRNGLGLEGRLTAGKSPRARPGFGRGVRGTPLPGPEGKGVNRKKVGRGNPR